MHAQFIVELTKLQKYKQLKIYPVFVYLKIFIRYHICVVLNGKRSGDKELKNKKRLYSIYSIAPCITHEPDIPHST